MNVSSFLQHWGILENPFKAEEAREDPVYLRIMDGEMTHPDFEKIYGSPEHPGTAVVFGEKGSGKTAIRLLIENRLRRHSEKNPDRMAWVVRYDDLNPVIDCIARRSRQRQNGTGALGDIRLADHMDAILSLVVTRLLDFLMGNDLDFPKPRRMRRQLRRMSLQKRIDLAVMVLLYDQPKASNPMSRWQRTKKILRVGKTFGPLFVFRLSALLLILAGVAGVGAGLFETWRVPLWSGAAGLALSLTGFYRWGRQSLQARKLAAQIHQEVRVIEQEPDQLRAKLGSLLFKDLQPLPLPIPGNEDSRYELMARLRGILEEIGFTSMFVLIDRIDEPALVNGKADRMRSIIWPLLNNKFLQQDRVGFKLLLPIELSHLLKKEAGDFFLKARLDKQNMIERLVWSGHTLYDICTRRLLGCLGPDVRITKLTDIFEEGVTRQDITDALDQMRQPRDAFKFLYRVIQEHCQNTSDEHPEWRIPKAVLDQTRKQESQRVQDLSRGLTPA